MLQERQRAHDEFRQTVGAVLGQAFAAAGYELLRAPLQWAGGKLRFVKSMPDAGSATIDFQALVASDTPFSAGMPSRFTVVLTRADGIKRGLSQLIVADFGVAILPTADHWWTYRDRESLAQALLEAGHLIVGYGLPWLAGELSPPAARSAQKREDK